MGALSVLAGAGLLATSMACGAGGDAPASVTESEQAVPEIVDEEAPLDADEELRDRVLGRAFADMASASVEDGTLGADEDAPPKPLQPIVLEGFDPSRFTEEALAENPLVMGVEKREPFQLAEGADPLDPASYDWEQDKDGYWIVSFWDLSLEDVDAELLLDALVYPDEYEGEEIHFPDRIRALDGHKVALTGYMIAIKWNKDRLKHFMLVRDLKSCCFGQQPEADEWVDVPMNGPGTDYIQYVPVTARGVFRLMGSSDPAGYAIGAFKIEGEDAFEE